MKKTIVLLTAIGFALVLGIAFTGEVFALAASENGITDFAIGAVDSDTGFTLAAVTTEPYTAWEPGVTMDNGVTIFARGPVSYDSGLAETGSEALSAEGSAAGGLSEGEGLHVENGITIFSTEPVDSN